MDESAKPPASVSASAEIKAEVPTASVGRLVDALTDIIRPFTEKRGFKADMIRLQREDVAIDIARRARKRREIDAAPIQPVPIKILGPLLERGSLEEPDDEEMIDRWAELLANASIDDGVEPRFISILSELTGRHAQFLENVLMSDFPETNTFPDSLCKKPFDGIYYEISADVFEECIEAMCRGAGTEKQVTDSIAKSLSGPGIFMGLVTSNHYVVADDNHEPFFETRFVDDDGERVSLEVLTSLGLLSAREARINFGGSYTVDAEYFIVTQLGVSFILSCSKRAKEWWSTNYKKMPGKWVGRDS